MTHEDMETSHHIIESLEAKEQRNRSLSIRIADIFTSSFGSIWFLIGNFIFFILWIGINTGHVKGVPVFDPFPFIFLTMAVSLEAIFLSIIVLMSQTRQSYVSTLREELDMQVNLMSEREITKVLEILTVIMKYHKIKYDDRELDDMIKATDISYIERQLENQLNRGPKPSKLVQNVEKEIDKVAKDIGI